MSISSILLLAAQSGLFLRAERAYLEAEGFEDLVVHFDGTFDAVKDGTVCTGTVRVIGSFRLYTSWCATGQHRRGEEPVCRPWEPQTCVDEAGGADLARQAELLSIACLHGLGPACNGWDRMDGRDAAPFAALYEFGCARGERLACVKRAEAALEVRDTARAEVALLRACDLGGAQVCENLEHALDHQGLPALADAVRAHRSRVAEVDAP